jgi:hypothetical protein
MLTKKEGLIVDTLQITHKNAAFSYNTPQSQPYHRVAVSVEILRATRTSDPVVHTGAEMNELGSARASPRTKLNIISRDTEQDITGMRTSVTRRDPAKSRAYWDNVRAELWVDDAEIKSSKVTAVPKRPKALNGGMKPLASRLQEFDIYQSEIRADKSRISMMLSAERR